MQGTDSNPLSVYDVSVLLVVELWEIWISRQYRLNDKEVDMDNLDQTLSSQGLSIN